MSFRVSAETTKSILCSKYRFSEGTAEHLINSAWYEGKSMHGNPNGPGWITVLRHDYPGKCLYSVTENIEKTSAGMARGVAHPGAMEYNRGNANLPSNRKRKAIAMPPRGRRAAAAAPAEPEEPEVGKFDHHLTKELSATMNDYADWFHENVTDINELGESDPGRLLALGSTLYPHFQKSDFNQNNRAARQSERAKAAPAEPDEPEPPAKPARRGRPAAAAPAAPAPAPAPARRGRATKSAAAAY